MTENRCGATLLLVVWTTFTAAAAGGAKTLRVPEEHETVQAGLVAASPGDTVLVGPGTYTEYILMPAGVALIAEKGPDSTRLVSTGVAERLVHERVMEIAAGADRSTLVEGFAFDPGEKHGTAIFCENASPTIRGNVTDGVFGYGINIRHGKPLVDGNLIRDSNAFGILVFASSPEIVRNTITGCAPRGIEVAGAKSHPVIGGGDPAKANRFYGNQADIVLSSVNDIDATGNDWGWATTAEMASKPYPTDVSTITDGNDKGKTHRGRGVVDYRGWIEPEPDSAAPGGGNRWLLPALIGAALALVVIVFVRR